MIKSLYPKPLSYTEYLIDKVKYNFLPDSLRFKLLFKETIKKKNLAKMRMILPSLSQQPSPVS